MNTNNAEITVNQVCEWTGAIEYDPYFTSCGHMFNFDEGSATDNNFRFCPFCGKTLIEVEDEDGEEQD